MDKIKLQFNSFKLVLDHFEAGNFVNELFDLCAKYSQISDIEYTYEYKNHKPEMKGPQPL